jgi:hypothetical protein
VLEALDQDPVAVGQLGDELVHRRRGSHRVLAHLGEAPVRSDDDLERAGLPVPPGILAFVVDVEIVVRVLDDRDALAGQAQPHDQLLDQGGLAGARITAEADDIHRPEFMRADDEAPGRAERE